MGQHTNEVNLLANEGWDERILVCSNGRLVKTFIVLTGRYVVLVDTVINPETATRMVDFARLYMEDGRQLLVVNTHADYDHAWGNQVFAGPEALHPAPIIATWRCAQQFGRSEADSFLEEMQAQEPEIFGDVVLTPPTILFDERLVVDGGDLTLELFATPGHTPDHIALYMPEIDTLLAADGAEVPFPFARTVEGLPRMRESLARMAALNPATVLYCHAPVTMGPQLLHHNMGYFDTLENHCRQALAQGMAPKPGEEADVAALIDCSFDEATPDAGEWQNIPEEYKSRGHAVQIRMMLEYIASQQSEATRSQNDATDSH